MTRLCPGAALGPSPTQQVFRELKRRGVPLAGWPPSRSSSGPASAIRSTISPMYAGSRPGANVAHELRSGNLPGAMIRITDSFEEVRRTAERFGVIVVDNTITTFGHGYVEHLDLFPGICIAADECVLILNVCPSSLRSCRAIPSGCPVAPRPAGTEHPEDIGNARVIRTPGDDRERVRADWWPERKRAIVRNPLPRAAHDPASTRRFPRRPPSAASCARGRSDRACGVWPRPPSAAGRRRTREPGRSPGPELGVGRRTTAGAAMFDDRHLHRHGNNRRKPSDCASSRFEIPLERGGRRDPRWRAARERRIAREATGRPSSRRIARALTFRLHRYHEAHCRPSRTTAAAAFVFESFGDVDSRARRRGRSREAPPGGHWRQPAGVPAWWSSAGRRFRRP
jgi:hypothetical protein